jgi:hypothetical protein
MRLQVAELVAPLTLALHLLPLAETHSPQMECHRQILFKVVTVELVHRSAPGLPFQEKTEMQMQSLELHSSLVQAVAAADGMPLEQLAEIMLVARVVQTMLLVNQVVTLAPVVAVQVQAAGQAVTAQLEL